MITVMREKFGRKIIGAIVALIAFVFIFYGIFMPGRGGGSSPNAAGEVNGETINYTEFSRALNQRLEFFKSLMGGKVSEEQLAQFKVREAVFKDLAQRKLLIQIAKKEGFYPSIEEVREHILTMEAFKKDGRFDKVLYKNVLNQNQYTPTRFEELIAQDLLEQNFKTFLGSLASVSPDLVEKELKGSKEKRKIKYIYLDHEAVRKTLAVKKDLKIEEQNKLLNDKVEELSKSVLPALTAGQDAKVNAQLKPLNFTVKTSEWLTAQSDFVAGVGSIRSAQDEIFKAKKGDPAKKYSLIGGTLIATVVDSENFDASKVTAKDRADTYSKLQNQKQNELLSELIGFWWKKASITRNDMVVVGGKGGNVPLDLEQ